MKSSTIASPFVLNMLQGAQAKGLNIQEMLLACGIAPSILDYPQARITFPQMAKLSSLVVSTLDDEYFGLTSKPQRQGCFKFACYSAMQARDVEELLHLLVEFNTAIDSDFIHEIVLEEEQARYQVIPKPDVTLINHYAIEHVLFGAHRAICWFSNKRLAVTQATFEFSAPDYVDEYVSLFYGAPVLFNRSVNSFSLKAHDLTRKICRGQEEVKKFLAAAPMTLLSQPDIDGEVTIQLRLWLERELMQNRQFPSMEQACSHFDIHHQSLRRKLAKSGTTFKGLKAELRRDIAINLVLNSDDSIEMISEVLDFSEASSFIRSFKQWTGLTPYAYRKASHT
ncbi:AraC family transcriptional regulator [Maricurvus nonylphenolicus]|uniref:AraC family transcriptional regulator n=1 Tax=Maricurvus nonylphenolicus TaxID=1008307 RepID=UPI0036F1CDB5